jgi:acyl dehydratase
MATRALSSPPRLLGLYARTAAPLLPGASLLPFLGGRGGELPDLELTLAQLRVDPDHLAAYAHVCGFSLRDELPATYPHVLAFGLHLTLMADRRFPFGAVGLVHVANRIVQHRPLRLGEALDLRVLTAPLKAHPRGRTFALVSEVRVEEELVWEDHSTMLRRGPVTADSGTGPAGPGSSAGDPETRSDPETHSADTREERPEPPPRGAVWRLPGDLGRRYAAVSGDRNPIHMHALAAKAFGFPCAIAHGMWTQARCLAALEQRLPDSYSVEVEFRRPILLPATVAFGSVAEGSTIRFAVHDAASERETRHLDGRVEPHPGGATTAGSTPGTQARRGGQRT